MTTAPTPDLLPCPFCGAGNTEIRENGKVWSGMGYTRPTSTSVFHHCTPTAGQPSRAIERVGRDRASAIAAWNQRAKLEARKPLPLPLSVERLDELWASQRGFHGGEPLKMGHVEFARLIEVEYGVLGRIPMREENGGQIDHSLIASREVVAGGPLRVTRLHLTEEGRAGLTSKATGPLPGITGGSS